MTRGRTRQITELVVKYKLHSNLKDLFVEGEKDIKFFQLVFKYFKLKINTYKISTVDVHQNIADNLKLNLKLYHSCRNKVITLAHALNASLEEKSTNQCRCVVDKDYDFFLNKLFSCPILLYTDYNCIEMYVFDELAISKFILALPKFPVTAQELMLKFEQVLPIFYLFRLTNESLKLGLQWKNFIDNCEYKKCEIIFDFKTFLSKFFNNNSINKSNQQKFLQEFEKNKKKLTTDIRNQIHKDDFKKLFIKYIRKCGRITDFNKNSELFPLMSCVEINEIKKEGLFIELINWYNKK